MRRTTVFLFGLFLFFVGSAAAQTAAPAQPADRLVMVSCYARWLVPEPADPADPKIGQEFVFLKSEVIPPGIMKPVVELQLEFIKAMAEGGMKVGDHRSSTCDKVSGPPRAVLVLVMFSFIPRPEGGGKYRIRMDAYLKMPGEGRAMPVVVPAARGEGVASAVANSVMKKITENEVKEQSPAPPANS